MQELQGKYTSAIIYANDISEGVKEQTLNICNHPIFENCKVRIMPDCHEGKGLRDRVYGRITQKR